MREIKGFEGIYWMNEVGEIFSKKGKKKPIPYSLISGLI